MITPDATFVEEAPDHRRYDRAFEGTERFPPSAKFLFVETDGRVGLSIDGVAVGDGLSDARIVADGYRFHDALHIALAARLGWSPVLRAMMGRKRRSDPEVDECEDGGRACMVEEAVCHVIFVHRLDVADSSDRRRVTSLIKRMVEGFEVERAAASEWSEAIDAGLEAMAALTASGGGGLHADFEKGRLVKVP